MRTQVLDWPQHMASVTIWSMQAKDYGGPTGALLIVLRPLLLLAKPRTALHEIARHPAPIAALVILGTGLLLNALIQARAAPSISRTEAVAIIDQQRELSLFRHAQDLGLADHHARTAAGRWLANQHGDALQHTVIAADAEELTEQRQPAEAIELGLVTLLVIWILSWVVVLLVRGFGGSISAESAVAAIAWPLATATVAGVALAGADAVLSTEVGRAVWNVPASLLDPFSVSRTVYDAAEVVTLPRLWLLVTTLLGIRASTSVA